MTRPGPVAWLTGLPASGKTTLGLRLLRRLRRAGVAAVLLDSDALRGALGRPAGRGEAERDAFYRLLARLAVLLSAQGLAVVVAATAPRRRHRAWARARCPRFLEVHVATSAEACARRDPKRLWAAARAGRVRGLPGAGAAYEPPHHPEVVASGGRDGRALRALGDRLAPRRRAVTRRAGGRRRTGRAAGGRRPGSAPGRRAGTRAARASRGG